MNCIKKKVIGRRHSENLSLGISLARYLAGSVSRWLGISLERDVPINLSLSAFNLIENIKPAAVPFPLSMSGILIISRSKSYSERKHV
jgi:hypothetical protein